MCFVERFLCIDTVVSCLFHIYSSTGFFPLLRCSFTAEGLCLDRTEVCNPYYMHIVLYIDNMYFMSSGVTRSLQCSPGDYLTFVAQGKGWDKRIIITAAECS